MKFVLAFDSFKGSIDSPQVCSIVEECIKVKIPEAEIVCLPMADGGENTAPIIAEVLGGEMKTIGYVQGPLTKMKVLAGYGSILEKKIAIVEVAIASGIALLAPDNLAPIESSTFGTGELLNDAFKNDYETVYLSLGGSATNDGGMGAAVALGWNFLDKDGEQLAPCGKSLIEIEKVIAPTELSNWPKVKVLCDVHNPLYGNNGAAYVFGPQKGADQEQIEFLDKGLRNLARVVKKDLGKDIANIQGAGAAGGFGAGAVAFLNAELVPGIDTIMEWLDFAKHVDDADWIITGEGCLDDTSFQGKVLSGVSKIAREKKVKLAAIAGRVKASSASLIVAGVDVVEAAAPSTIPDVEALANSVQLLKEATNRIVVKMTQ